MGKYRRVKKPPTDLNEQPIGADLPPLEFKGKREPPSKRKNRNRKDTDTQGRRRV